MGANGAGKSTLVKILTGAVRADAGRILIRGAGARRALARRRPPRRAGPGLPGAGADPRPRHRRESAAHRHAGRSLPRAGCSELGIARSRSRATTPRDIPLAVLRVLDLARALAIEPDVLLLDEMTAALPANLAERVLDVVRRPEPGRAARSSSSRTASRDLGALRPRHRAARRRDRRRRRHGAGRRGTDRRADARRADRQASAPAPRRQRNRAAATAASPPRLGVRNLRVGTKLDDVSFDLRPRRGRSASSRSKARARTSCSASCPARSGRRAATIEVDGNAGPVRAIRPTRSAPASPMSPATAPTRSLMQRSVAREHRPALQRPPRTRGVRSTCGRRSSRVDDAIERLQIDTRAQREVQRLSGGNQQKVTIARWIAAEARTILCFDPTRGIDVRTKQRDLPAAARARRARRVGAVLHLRARGGAARLRPRHRHLRRPRGRRAARSKSPTRQR